jgi:hypothetical protein
MTHFSGNPGLHKPSRRNCGRRFAEQDGVPSSRIYRMIPLEELSNQPADNNLFAMLCYRFSDRPIVSLAGP